MVKNNLVINLLLNDRASKDLQRARKNVGDFGAKSKKSFVDIAAKVFLFQQAVAAANRVLSVFVKNASKVEQLGVRLEVLLGTVEEGNRLFDDMRDLASRLPFEFDQIMESATNLAAVVRGGADEVNKLMPIITDLAAATGISVRDTTSQMIRMYSSGAASADMFRERGVLAMLGFQAGVSVSAKNTMDQVVAAWEDPSSKFRGATDKLQDTWEGRISMLKDSWFNFTAEVGKGIIEDEGIKDIIDTMTEALNTQAESVKQNIELGQQAGVSAMDRMMAPLEKLITGTSMLTTKMRNQRMAIVDLGKVTVELDKKRTIAHKKSKEQLASEKSLRRAGFTDAVAIMDMLAEKNKAFAIASRGLSFTRAVISSFEAHNKALALCANPIWASVVLALGLTKAAMIAAQPLAEGGIVTRPTHALIGEAGPEAVIPLDKSSNIMGDTNITIIIEGGIDSGGRTLENTAEELGFMVDAELRNARGF